MINKKCCNKEMVYLGDLFSLDRTISENKVWICGECGNFKDERTYQYDDEELIDVLENHKDKLKDTKIYKELIKDNKTK